MARFLKSIIILQHISPFVLIIFIITLAAEAQTSVSSQNVTIYGFAVEPLDASESPTIELTMAGVSVLELSSINLRLFGKFIQGVQLKFSSSGHSCAGNAMEYEIEIENNSGPEPSNSESNASITYHVAIIKKLTIPKQSSFSKIYFCLYDPDQKTWIPQGSSSWLSLRVHKSFFPLWLLILLIIILLFLSGLFSGLNLGLMSLTRTDIKILMSTGDKHERIWAGKISPIRNHGNYLLCCLLFSNVLVNSTLTILMDEIVVGAAAILLSTIVIVIFGEIIPQAICSRHGLSIGARTIYLTKFFMAVTFIVAYPLSVILDKCLGEEVGSKITRDRLKELLRVTEEHHGLQSTEADIISGALDLKNKTAKHIMTRTELVFMLPLDTILDYETVSEIEELGYTRIPIYDKVKSHVVAVLNVKQLTLLDAGDMLPVRVVVDYYENPILFVFENTRLDYLFHTFRRGSHGHMAFVQRITDRTNLKVKTSNIETVGVVTMEDVLEELIQGEIMDETDVEKLNTRFEAIVNKPELPINKRKHKRSPIVIPPTLALAAIQLLQYDCPPFSRNLLTEEVLLRLIKACVNVAKPGNPFKKKTPSRIYLYENGKPSDTFIMILQGAAEVEIGTENVKFPAKPFQYFGTSLLLREPSSENIQDYKKTFKALTEDLRKWTFVPDFTVRVTEECFYLDIKYSAYRAALLASRLHRTYLENPDVTEEDSANWDAEMEEILNVMEEDVAKRRRLIYISYPGGSKADTHVLRDKSSKALQAANLEKKISTMQQSNPNPPNDT